MIDIIEFDDVDIINKIDIIDIIPLTKGFFSYEVITVYMKKAHLG